MATAVMEQILEMYYLHNNIFWKLFVILMIPLYTIILLIFRALGVVNAFQIMYVIYKGTYEYYPISGDSRKTLYDKVMSLYFTDMIEKRFLFKKINYYDYIRKAYYEI